MVGVPRHPGIRFGAAGAALLLGLALPRLDQVRAAESSGPGVAVAIVFDTSGSMSESVPDTAGKPTPKYMIANRALTAIVGRLEEYVKSAPADAPRALETGLFVFAPFGKIKEAVAFGRFNAEALRAWAKSFSKPGGGTPLGEALRVASEKVLRSSLARKHVLVVTDGLNTVGTRPEDVLPGLKQRAAQQQATLAVHFVAFDVDARQFDPVKKLGATVVGAADEKQLNTQIEFILQHQILLEDEEPKPAAGANQDAGAKKE